MVRSDTLDTMKKAIASLLLLTSGTCAAAEFGGFQIEDVVRIRDYSKPMLISGGAVYSRNFVPFYVASLHLPTQGFERESIVDALVPCRITVIWMVHNMSSERVRSYWEDALARSLGSEDELERIRSRVDQFLELLGDVKRGQTIELDYNPDSGMRVNIDGEEKGWLAGVELNRGLIGIFLGESANPAVRTALLEGAFRAQGSP